MHNKGMGQWKTVKRTGWRRFNPFESDVAGIVLLIVLFALIALPIVYIVVKFSDRITQVFQ